MRLTKIICTLGPASHSYDAIRTLAKGGMNIARVNLSHGSTEEHERTIADIQRMNTEDGTAVAVMIDTRGCEIRTGDVAQPIAIHQGQEVLFSPHDIHAEKRAVIHVNYDGFAQDVSETDRIVLDNGSLFFSIAEIRPDGSVLARAQEDGHIGSRRHINLPGADIDLPSVTAADWVDIRRGARAGVDFVALSFVRSAAEVREVQSCIVAEGSHMQVVAKIETQQALVVLPEIIAAADGIMVARGDLGAELPFEQIPAIQDRIVSDCIIAGKPVIVATHMLESMTMNPTPTRAEVMDVSHAAVTRTDCTMLSGETATGAHPAVALDAMDRILRETETHLPSYAVPTVAGSEDDTAARAAAAATMARTVSARAILTFTHTGRNARMISRHRPNVPIITITDKPAVLRQLQLAYGIIPLLLPFSDDPEENVTQAFTHVLRSGILTNGDAVILLSDARTRGGTVRTLQVRTVA